MIDSADKRTAVRSGLAIPAAFAVLKLLMHLPVLHRYGYHHDELYFLACGEHLAFGYVDHAPLVPWIAAFADTVFGQSLVGLRIFPALAGAAAIFLTGLLVKRLGGGWFAQGIACLAMLIAPVYVRSGNLLCIPAFEPLFWLACAHILVSIIDKENPKLWMGLGLVAGIGLMNKHSMLFFGFGLVVAMLLTPLRRYFKSPWLYAGGAAAFLVFLPNILWQMANDWPTVTFLRGLNEGAMSGISALQFTVGQILYLHPFTAPLWIAGLVFFFTRAGKPYRVFGWMYVAVFVLLVVIKSKIYYLAPAYPPLLAGGGIVLERFTRERSRKWLRPATVAAFIIGGLIFVPLSLPVMSLRMTEKYIHTITFHAFENVFELVGDLYGMHGWPERVEAVAEVYNGLPEEEQARTVIFSGSYGLAGAVDYFGDAYGLPNATSGAMTYHLWGLPDHPIDHVIAAYIGQRDLERLREVFESVEVAHSVKIFPYDGEDDMPFRVFLCRNAKVDLHEIWPETRDW